MDVFSAREPVPFDDFAEAWREFRQVLLEDGSVGAGAQADEPYMEVFLDSWKGIEVQVPVGMRDDAERILARHGLEEVPHTWPPEVDERAEPPLNVREILVLDDEECPLWHVVAVVESADEDHPRAGYALAWATAASLGEVQRMIESRIELQDEWRFHGQWYGLDRVAYDERPESLGSIAPRRAHSEIHEFRIEPA